MKVIESIPKEDLLKYLEERLKTLNEMPLYGENESMINCGQIVEVQEMMKRLK